MRTGKKVAFYTLGCKLNFAETSSIARQLHDSGFVQVDFHDSPNVYVINTCSVTDNANRKCREIVRQALRRSPGAFIAVIGCYAQLKPEEIASIPGVDLVLGAAEKFNIAEHIAQCEKQSSGKVIASEIKHVNEFVSSYSSGDRTRSFLKVQDGCDYFCSFCTIPLARGRSRSDTIINTLKQAEEVAKKGFKEVVLTGVNIGDFGKNKGETFYQLILRLEKINGIERYRISSIEPNLLTDDIIKFVSYSKKFVPHFHVPLQSGSNKILALMRRRYKRELYLTKIKKIKSIMPHCCIGADVIAGFPGETEQDFTDTYNFINDLEVSYLHVFSYSERDNTTAIRIKETVPLEERRKRNNMLRNLSEKKRRYFYEQNTGREATVLFEENKDGKEIYGFTENYIKVKTVYDPSLINQIKDVRLTRIDKDGIMLVEEIYELVPKNI